jgi:sterol desaturase/sphingolipid hydroxylase (fatty acid hydroxylase superfamily)
VADRVAAAADVATDAGRRAKARARAVAEVGGVAAVVAGGLVLTATSATLTSTTRAWKKGSKLDLGNGVLPWTIGMVWWDLAYYWNHRLQHEIRAMWAIHVPHHSSERYNLSTALRQPVAGAFGVWVPYGAVARIGVRPSIIETSRALNLIYQYWIHTDTVRSLGPAEEVLNTPSHHRVHHGSNRRYIDRNHAGILIVWDRMFGTFSREEPDEEPVVYGLTKNIHTFNLWKVSTHEYLDMFRDVARSTNWRDRLGFVLRGPGWAYRRRDELDALEVQEALAMGAAAAAR